MSPRELLLFSSKGSAVLVVQPPLAKDWWWPCCVCAGFCRGFGRRGCFVDCMCEYCVCSLDCVFMIHVADQQPRGCCGKNYPNLPKTCSPVSKNVITAISTVIYSNS